MEKILTISVAAYNVGAYLDKTINSIVKVEKDILDLIQIIIVNDGSKDNTLNVAQIFKEKYPKSIVIIDKSNGGYGSTINASIEVAEGKYFKQLDGDDWFFTENLADFVNFLNNTDSDYVISPYIEFYEDNNVEKEVTGLSYISSNNNKIEDVKFVDNIHMHELTIKTSILRDNNIRITENTFYTDNEYTFLPLEYVEYIARFDKPVYVYRLGRAGQSISLQGVRAHYKDIMVVAKKIISNYSFQSYSKNCSLLKIKYEELIDAVYTYYLSSGDKHAKSELLGFDKWLKNEFYDLYVLSDDIKKVKLLRKSNFVLFKLLSKIILVKW